MRLTDGVSGHLDPTSGRVKVMWRNREQQADGSIKQRQRKLTSDSLPEARELAVQIAASLKRTGWFELGQSAFRPAVEDLERVFKAYLDHKVKFERVRPNTRSNLARSFQRFGRGMRSLLALSNAEVIPAEAMTLENYRRWVMWAGSVGTRAGGAYGPGTIYQSAHTVLDAWGWAADQGRWMSLPAPPYNRRAHLPPSPQYGPPADTATWAEMDAAIARIRADRGGPTPNVGTAKYSAIIQRFTGLRLFQAIGMHAEDIDIGGNTLIIRRGKSRREAALMRRIAVSPHLWVALEPVLAHVTTGPLFPDRSRPDSPMVSYRNTTRYVTRAWNDAIEDGLARITVVRPPNRDKGSPTHCFRSGFMAQLAANGVSDAVLDHLVGHAPGSVRGQHYTTPSLELQHQAVSNIPSLSAGT
ncbi:MAG: site-specific integrase [Myxococcota bacterium]